MPPALHQWTGSQSDDRDRLTLQPPIYCGDERMLVNAHVFGINAYAVPVWHLHRETDGGMFDRYAESFEAVSALSRQAVKE